MRYSILSDEHSRISYKAGSLRWIYWVALEREKTDIKYIGSVWLTSIPSDALVNIFPALRALREDISEPLKRSRRV